MRGVMPYLQVEKADEAIAWYEKVFKAKETRERMVTPDGKCMNAEIEIEGTRVMIADEMPGVGSMSPLRLKGTSVVLNLHVADSDIVFKRALGAGAVEVFPLTNQFYGDRAGRIFDPFGHHWIIATKVKNISDDEMMSAFKAMFKEN